MVPSRFFAIIITVLSLIISCTRSSTPVDLDAVGTTEEGNFDENVLQIEYVHEIGEDDDDGYVVVDRFNDSNEEDIEQALFLPYEEIVITLADEPSENAKETSSIRIESSEECLMTLFNTKLSKNIFAETIADETPPGVKEPKTPAESCIIL